MIREVGTWLVCRTDYDAQAHVIVVFVVDDDELWWRYVSSNSAWPISRLDGKLLWYKKVAETRYAG